MFNPWAAAREAERRAAIAEERAAFLEQHIAWMREQVTASKEGEVTALKIGSNIAHQAAWGFVPFPEVASIAPKESRIRELEIEEEEDPVREARSNFRAAELRRFEEMQTK